MEGKILGLGHIGLFISDISRTRAFYTQVLHFEEDFSYVGDNGDKVIFLKLGDCIIEAVELNEPMPENCRCNGFFNHLALKVENIEAVRENLLTKNIAFEEGYITYCSKCYPNGAKWILFHGPDGERLEITEVL